MCKNLKLFILIPLLAGLFSACKKESAEPVADGIVAAVGSFEISDTHFKNELIRFYYRTGQAVNINPELRKTVVDARLDRYTMVEYARDKGWHRDSDAQYNLAVIERKVHMEEFERRFIHDQVQVTENDLRTLYQRLNTSLRASHLYAANRPAAEALYERVNGGESFENLAREVFSNPSLAENGGDLGFFTVDDMDVAFENTAYQLKPGEISHPVKTSTGYSLIKVTERITTPVITESEFNRRRRDIEPLALQQKKELATRTHMEMVEASFRKNETAVDLLWDDIQSGLALFSSDNPSLEEFFSIVSDADGDQVLLENDRLAFTVSDFIQEAYYTPAIQRASVSNVHAFNELLYGLAYRSFALSQVREHPSFDHFYVSGSIDETFYNYLIERFDAHIKGQVVVNENQIRDEFRKNSELYRDPLELNLAEIVVTSESSAEQAWTELQSGNHFNDVLNRYTADREAIEWGGELGYIAINHFGMMSQELASVKPGDLAGPFQLSSNRYVIFKCLGRKEPREITLEEAKPRVKEYLTGVQFEVLKNKTIAQARQTFNATIFTERLNALPIEL